jgi:hypothetical protein
MLDLDAVERADAIRRGSREAAELIELASLYYGNEPSDVPAGVDPYHYSRSISGVPSNRNRSTRVSESSWDRMERPTWSECVSTVNGVSTVFKPSKASKTSKAAVTTQNAQQARRLALLESCGNATELVNE